MPLHYNAFISYKHAPADIAVAKDIQHQLEHYRVPKAVRQKTGREKIERIFRDQEELPITSDLSKDIDEALQDAEFLIVICSSSTKLSTWVPREIARFLEFHDRDHVLTVLVDGEPNEVIPQILLEETLVETDENGTEQTYTKIYEPLSCDYRGSLRQARKTEIPRLAAALLGCSYDELVMRARQYKLRRLTAFAAAGGILALGAITYLIWSNRQIQSNYERAEENRILAETNYQKAEENRQLAEANYQKAEENRQLAEENYEEAQANLLQARRSQITLLANESINARNRENRILAAQLALAALPGEGKEDWPRMALAEYALTRTIDAYTPYYSGASYSAVWDMEMRGNIQGFKVQRAKSLVYACDYYGDIGAWSLTDYRELFRVMPGKDVDDIYICDHEGKTDLLVDYEESLVMLDGESGAVKWSFEAGQFGSGSGANCQAYLSGEEIYAFAEYLRPVSGWDFERRLLICRLDPETGQILWQNESRAMEGGRGYQIALSKEENALYYCFASHTEGSLFCCDLKSGKTREIETELAFGSVAYLSKPEDGRIILYGVEEGEVHTGSYSLLGTTALVTRRASLLCLDTESGQTLWRSGFESSDLQYLEDACSSGTIDHTDAKGVTHKLILTVFGRNVYLFDRENGSLYEECTLNAAPVSINTYVSGQGFVSVLRNGNLISYQIGQDGQYASQLIQADTVYHAVLCFPHEDRISYLVKTERAKLQLFDMSFDDGAQSFDGTEAGYGYFSGVRLFHDRYFAVCTRPDYSGPWLIDLFDLESKARILHLEEQFSGYSVTVLGMDPSGRWLLISQNAPYQVLAFDVSQKEEPRCFDVSKETGASFRECRLIGDRIAVLQYGANLGQLLLLEVQEDGSLKQEACLPFSGVPGGGTSVKFGGADDDGRFVCLVQYESGSGGEIRPAVLVCELETGRWSAPDFQTEATNVAMDHLPAQALFAFADRKTLEVFDESGTLLYTVADPSRTVEAFHFCPAEKSGLEEDLLLVVTRDEDYRMDRYRASDGMFLGSCDVTRSNSDVTESRWTFTEGEIVLWLDDVINFIDTAEWICTAAAPQCLAYSASRRTLISLEYRDAYRPVWYPRYSLEELIRKGQEFLKGLEMSDSVKSLYGIE